jgi:hypothetical protein
VVYCPSTRAHAAGGAAQEAEQGSLSGGFIESVQRTVSKAVFGWWSDGVEGGSKQSGEGVRAWRLSRAPGLGPLLLDAAPY